MSNTPLTNENGIPDAVRAWNQLTGRTCRDITIDPLSRSRKQRAVFRLVAVGTYGSDVIAKWRSDDRVHLERFVYEEILPQLNIPVLEYYGSVRTPDSPGTWLFIADAAGRRYRMDVDEHRVLVAEWTARLHIAAAECVKTHRLPNVLPRRGPDYYRGHLESAIVQLQDALDNWNFSEEQRSLLATIAGRCRAVRASWSRIDSIYHQAPNSLVHGDLFPVNVRIQSNRNGMRVAVFDWDYARHGNVIRDLLPLGHAARTGRSLEIDPALQAYASVVSKLWSSVTHADVRRWTMVGVLMFILGCIAKDAGNLKTHWNADTLERMRAYSDQLSDSWASLG